MSLPGAQGDATVGSRINLWEYTTWYVLSIIAGGSLIFLSESIPTNSKSDRVTENDSDFNAQAVEK
jgi:hypothetical protein